MSLSPQQVIDTADGLTGLAAILSNPEAYQAKLDELKAHAQEGNEAFEKSQKNLAEAKYSYDDANFLKKEAEELNTRVSAENRALVDSVSKQKEELSVIQSKLASEYDTVQSTQEQISVLKNSLASKESEVKSRLAQVTALQKDLEGKLADAVSKSSYYDTLIAKVKASLG